MFGVGQSILQKGARCGIFGVGNKVIKQKAAGKYKLRMQEEVIQERGKEEEEELKSRARKPSLSERICARLVYAMPQCFLQVDVVGGKQLFQMKLPKR